MNTNVRQPIFVLPDEAFVVDAVDELECWFDRSLTVAPEWLREAFKSLEPIERHTFSSSQAAVGWAHESARLRLRLAALTRDEHVPNGAFCEALAELDGKLRNVARAEASESVRVQIGRIRQALRVHLARKLERRDRAAYMGARRVVF
jgi:hypothetical protein